MLTPRELDLLLSIIEEGKTITKLAEELNLSIYRVSALTNQLLKKGLINITKKGRYKIITPTLTKPILLLKKIKTQYSHIPLSKILTGNNLKLLSILKPEVFQDIKTLLLKTNLPKSSLYATINNLSNYGMIKKSANKYSLIKKYSLFHEFSKEYITLQNYIIAKKFAPDSAILWSGIEEFILAIKTYKNPTNNFQLTGLSKFSDYKLSLIGKGVYYYYYSKKKVQLTIEDVIIHSLVVDYTPRTILYTIVLALAYREKLNKKKLLDLGLKFDVKVDVLFDYLEGRGHEFPYPSIKEVYEVYDMYFGVLNDKQAIYCK